MGGVRRTKNIALQGQWRKKLPLMGGSEGKKHCATGELEDNKIPTFAL